jgi:hypothetical protein
MKYVRPIILFLAAWFALSVAMTGCTCVIHHHHQYARPGGVYVSGPPPGPAQAVDARDPQPSEVHVWISGHWDWDGSEWAWADGYWEVPPDDGAAWVEPEYEENEGDWIYTPGHWVWHEEAEDNEVLVVGPGAGLSAVGGDEGVPPKDAYEPGGQEDPSEGTDIPPKDAFSTGGTDTLRHPGGHGLSASVGGEESAGGGGHDTIAGPEGLTAFPDGDDDTDDDSSSVVPRNPDPHKKTPAVIKPGPGPVGPERRTGVGRTGGGEAAPAPAKRPAAPVKPAAPKQEPESPEKVSKPEQAPKAEPTPERSQPEAPAAGKATVKKPVKKPAKAPAKKDAEGEEETTRTKGEAGAREVPAKAKAR